MDERNQHLVPDDMAEVIEDIGYDSKKFTVNSEGIVQIRGFDKPKTESDSMFEKVYGMTPDLAEKKFGEFVDEFIRLREEKVRLKARLDEIGIDKEEINDKLYEIDQRLQFIIGMQSQLLDRPGFIGSENQTRFRKYTEENGWY